MRPWTGRIPTLFYWPDVILAVLFLVCAFWCWGITCLFSCFYLWERYAKTNDDPWSFALLFAFGTGCYVAGWQLAASRRSGLLFGLISLVGLFLWALLTRTWASPIGAGIPVALYCVLRAMRLFGP